MLALTHYAFNTYTKQIIQNWTLIATTITQKTQPIKDQVHQISINTNTPLTDQQLNDAFNGPFQQFLKSHTQSYATVARLELALTFSADEIIKTSKLDHPIEHGISIAQLSQTDYAAVKKAYAALDELTKTHLSEWEKYFSEWTEALLEILQANGLPLTDAEIQDFTLNEPISELNAHFIDLTLELPKLKKAPLDFQQYFLLKSTLAAHSVLSRLHKPNTSKDIELALKPCQALFKQIAAAEKALAKAQNQALTNVTHSLK